jgi:hypothetical protein
MAEEKPTVIFIEDRKSEGAAQTQTSFTVRLVSLASHSELGSITIGSDWTVAKLYVAARKLLDQRELTLCFRTGTVKPLLRRSQRLVEDLGMQEDSAVYCSAVPMHWAMHVSFLSLTCVLVYIERRSLRDMLHLFGLQMQRVVRRARAVHAWV